MQDLAYLKQSLMRLRKNIDDYEDDYAGLSVVGEEDLFGDGDDAASQFLQQQSSKPASQPAISEQGASQSKKPRGRLAPWKPAENIAPEQAAKIKQFMDEGFSEREAHRFAGTHKEHGHSDIDSATQGGFLPSMPSMKMLEHMKDVAREHNQKWKQYSHREADPEKNPQYYMAGRLSVSHDDHTQDYRQQYHDMLNSDEVKNLRGRERHQKIQEWKKNWHQENPQFNQTRMNIFNNKEDIVGAKGKAKESVQQKLQHIAGMGTGGQTYSTQEAQQHLGIGSKDDEQPVGVQQDRLSSFAQKNPEYAKHVESQLQSKIQHLPENIQQNIIKRYRNAKKGRS